MKNTFIIIQISKVSHSAIGSNPTVLVDKKNHQQENKDNEHLFIDSRINEKVTEINVQTMNQIRNCPSSHKDKITELTTRYQILIETLNVKGTDLQTLEAKRQLIVLKSYLAVGNTLNESQLSSCLKAIKNCQANVRPPLLLKYYMVYCCVKKVSGMEQDCLMISDMLKEIPKSAADEKELEFYFALMEWESDMHSISSERMCDIYRVFDRTLDEFMKEGRIDSVQRISSKLIDVAKRIESTIKRNTLNKVNSLRRKQVVQENYYNAAPANMHVDIRESLREVLQYDYFKEE